MAVNHVILKEFYCDRPVPYFVDYLKRFSDAPFLVELKKEGNGIFPREISARDPARPLSRHREWRMEVIGV